jgi:hypothetical protein
VLSAGELTFVESQQVLPSTLPWSPQHSVLAWLLLSLAFEPHDVRAMLPTNNNADAINTTFFIIFCFWFELANKSICG